MTRPPGLFIASIVAALAILASAVRVSAQDSKLPADAKPVAVATLDGATTLQAYLFSPVDDDGKPHPAIVMMHGCSGLMNPATGRFFGLYMPWVRALTEAGYAALVVDSATPRGLGQTCTGTNALAMWRERPKDAYAALKFLQQQAGVKPDRIALIGWSQGGGAVLYAINERTRARNSPQGQAILASMPHDFRAAVAFYPGACREEAQKPSMPPGSQWTSKVPLLVLFGDADVWTELSPCRTFLDAATARGNAVDLKAYPGAHHAFDAPNLKRTELPQYTTRDGRIPVIATDDAARADAFARVPAWLKARLQD